MYWNKTFYRLLTLGALIMAASCSGDADKKESGKDTVTDPKVEKLRLPAGFHAEHLYGPSENKEGSWVSMTFDDKGRLIASDQYGAIYRMELPPIGTDSAESKVKIEKLDFDFNQSQGNDSNKVKMGYAHGLLWAFNSLYVMINHEADSAFNRGSGFYRLQDTNNDDKFDKLTLLKSLDGEGEHGPHSAVLAPDGKSIYVIAGNFTKIPEMTSYRRLPDYAHDNLLPLIKDPNGHDNTVNTHGGWIANVDSTGTKWELVSSGFRNPFDLVFNDAGDMFAYDSDMEWDFGLPWYRPTRICHVTSGSEFGWRPGTGKWSPDYPDNLPALVNIGQGSPTGMFYGGKAHFPEKYRKAIYAFDWSFGIIYAIHAEPDGSGYKATGEEFISGSPLPLTDGVIGPDGALYFLTGGRRLESDLYRVYYGDNKENTAALAAPQLTDDQQTRRKLEEFHTAPKAGAVDFAWPYLGNKDRLIRFAARVALEHQPAAEWQEKALTEKDPVILTQAAIAFARHGSKNLSAQYENALTGIDFKKLSESQQVDLVRAFELILNRMGKPEATTKTAVGNYLTAAYPADNNELNRELSKVLGFLDAPGTVEKTMSLLATAKDDDHGLKTVMQSSDLILRNPQYGLDIAKMLARVPPRQQTFYATVLSQVKNGWTPELEKKYFEWYADAFKYKGGVSFVGFIDGARKMALERVPASQFAYFNKLSGDSIKNLSGDKSIDAAVRPKGPGREWTVEEAMPFVDSGITHRNFERGKAMFATSLCISCHTMRGEGGVAGPDLTQLGNRFTYKDMLEAITEPDKTVSDQYGSTIFDLKNGGSILGRMVSQDNDKYIISQNPFAPQTTRELLKSEVARTKTSKVSPMLPGLINSLNPEELKDLLAYLKSGGNQEDTIFAAGNKKAQVSAIKK